MERSFAAEDSGKRSPFGSAGMEMSSQHGNKGQNMLHVQHLHPCEYELHLQQHHYQQAQAQAQAHDQLSQRKRCFLDQEETSMHNGSSSDVSPGRKRMVGNDRSVHLLDALPVGWSPSSCSSAVPLSWGGEWERGQEPAAASSSGGSRVHGPLSLSAPPRPDCAGGGGGGAGGEREVPVATGWGTPARRRGEHSAEVGCDENEDSCFDSDRKRMCREDRMEQGEWGEWGEWGGETGRVLPRHPSAAALSLCLERRSRTVPAQFLPSLPVSPVEEHGQTTADMSLLMALASRGAGSAAAGAQWEALPPRAQRRSRGAGAGAGAGVGSGGGMASLGTDPDVHMG